jgi:hypothetical protein
MYDLFNKLIYSKHSETTSSTTGLEVTFGGQDIFLTDRAISTTSLTTGGSLWTVDDTFTIAGGTGGKGKVATITDGIINTHSMNDDGSGYVPLDSLTVADGTGATVRVDTVDVGGEVLTYTLTNAGSGYTVGVHDTAGSVGGSGFKLEVLTVIDGRIATYTITHIGSAYSTGVKACTAESGTGVDLTIDITAVTGTYLVPTTAMMDAKLAKALADGHIFVGSAGAVATDVALSGEATIVNTGAITLANSAVIGKVLTGFSAGSGTVAATDTILQAFQKVVGNVALGSVSDNVTLYDEIGTPGATIPCNGVAIMTSTANNLALTQAAPTSTLSHIKLVAGSIAGGKSIVVTADSGVTFVKSDALSTTFTIATFANANEYLEAYQGGATQWVVTSSSGVILSNP